MPSFLYLLRFSPDGKRLAVGAEDASLDIYDVSSSHSPSRVTSCKGIQSKVHIADFSQDRSYIKVRDEKSFPDQNVQKIRPEIESWWSMPKNICPSHEILVNKIECGVQRWFRIKLINVWDFESGPCLWARSYSFVWIFLFRSYLFLHSSTRDIASKAKASAYIIELGLELFFYLICISTSFTNSPKFNE